MRLLGLALVALMWVTILAATVGDLVRVYERWDEQRFGARRRRVALLWNAGAIWTGIRR
jgi:hypothetical protein